jgi:hypothetical protein
LAPLPPKALASSICFLFLPPKAPATLPFPCAAGGVSDAAYAAMAALLDPRHGGVHEAAAALFPRLSPVMLGTAAAPSAGRKGAADAAALRAAASTFVCEALG